MKEYAERALDNARKHYETARMVIWNACDRCNRYAKSNGKGNIASYDTIVGQFDMFLQGLLLRVAMDDKKVYGNEKVFIREIVRTDVINMLSKSSGRQLTWDQFIAFYTAHPQQLNDELDGFLDETSEGLVATLALADFCDDYTINVQSFLDCLMDIVMEFIVVDGDAPNSEAAISETLTSAIDISKYINEKYNTIKKEYKATRK